LYSVLVKEIKGVIIKMKPLKKVALTITLIWTVIVTILTLNLVISSKKSAIKNAKEDAFSAISHFSAIVELLTKDLNFINENFPVPFDSKELNSERRIISTKLDIDAPQMFLAIADKRSYRNSTEVTLEQWQYKLFDSLFEKNERRFFVDEINQNSYVRVVEPINIGEYCHICNLFEIENLDGYVGGIFVSVDMSKYFSESYSHARNMIRNLGFIWILGVAAIIYGYRKTSIAVSKKLRNYEESVYNLVDIIEKRDSYTAGHTQRVAKYAMLIANNLNVSKYKKGLLYRASMLHDIGKISTPDSILLKPGKLSDLEYRIIKDHVTTSYEILTKVTIYKDIAEIVRHHHEYYDGSGYPQGLKGDQIPFLSQIITVADGFDAMTTDRIYKGRKTVSEAIAEISQLSGRQFNPDIVKSAIKALSKVNTERKVSQLPESDLQQERFSYFYKDNVTHAYNQRYLELLLSKRNQELKKYRYVLLIRVHNFTQFNSENSWSDGDKKLSEIVSTLQGLEENHLVFRLFGDDFILLLKSKITPLQRKQLLNNELKNTCLNYSTCYIDLNEEKVINIDELERVMHTFKK
jgi:putative nucleotidyltransferase with HDIG domain